MISVLILRSPITSISQAWNARTQYQLQTPGLDLEMVATARAQAAQAQAITLPLQLSNKLNVPLACRL